MSQLRAQVTGSGTPEDEALRSQLLLEQFVLGPQCAGGARIGNRRSRPQFEGFFFRSKLAGNFLLFRKLAVGVLKRLFGFLDVGQIPTAGDQALELGLELFLLLGQGVGPPGFLGQLAIGLGQGALRLGESGGVQAGLGPGLFQPRLQQVGLLFEQPDALLGASQLPRVHRRRLHRQRLAQLGLEHGFVRLQLAHLFLQSFKLLLRGGRIQWWARWPPHPPLAGTGPVWPPGWWRGARGRQF